MTITRWILALGGAAVLTAVAGCANLSAEDVSFDAASKSAPAGSTAAPAGGLMAGSSADGAATGFSGDARATLKEKRAQQGLDDLAAEATVEGEATAIPADAPDVEDEHARSAVEGRKLIRTGTISVAVDDYEPFRAALDDQLEQLGGFVSDASLSHWSGRVSWATLTVRVPAEHFDALVGWTESEVEVESLDISTADVTEEWVDVVSRIDNHRRTEQRLQQLLEDRTADLADVLAVERELARVRGEIEAAEGRLRVLSDQVGLSTLTISVAVRNPYEPVVEQGFGAQVVKTFKDSLSAMVTVGKGLTLMGVAVAPWLLILAVIALVFVLAIRALIRRRSA